MTLKETLQLFLASGDYSLLNPRFVFRYGRWILEKPGRNEPCMCGSNKKYKKCCGR